MSDGRGVEQRDGEGDHVVATDHTRYGQAFVRPHLHLGVNASDGASDWRAGDRVQNLYRRVAGEHADRAATGGRSEVGPDDVASGYHSGAVTDASRAAAVTICGSCGAR